MLALLVETSVLTHPGYFFDFPNESFLIVSLLTPETRVRRRPVARARPLRSGRSIVSASLRRSGLLIPLFSAPSSDSWGVGDIGDIAALSTWLAGGGQQILQLLPLNEMASGYQSPYSAMSAMAIDPHLYPCT